MKWLVFDVNGLKLYIWLIYLLYTLHYWKLDMLLESLVNG